MSLTMNQAGVIANRFQNIEDYKRVVTVCSAGCLRSPTAAVVLAQDPFNFNTRAAGLTDDFALITLSASLLSWADEFVVMEPAMEAAVRSKYLDAFDREPEKPIIVLDIPDIYAYRDPELMEMIKARYIVATTYKGATT